MKIDMTNRKALGLPWGALGSGHFLRIIVAAAIVFFSASYFAEALNIEAKRITTDKVQELSSGVEKITDPALLNERLNSLRELSLSDFTARYYYALACMQAAKVFSEKEQWLREGEYQLQLALHVGFEDAALEKKARTLLDRFKSATRQSSETIESSEIKTKPQSITATTLENLKQKLATASTEDLYPLIQEYDTFIKEQKTNK